MIQRSHPGQRDVFLLPKEPLLCWNESRTCFGQGYNVPLTTPCQVRPREACLPWTFLVISLLVIVKDLLTNWETLSFPSAVVVACRRRTWTIYKWRTEIIKEARTAHVTASKIYVNIVLFIVKWKWAWTLKCLKSFSDVTWVVALDDTKTPTFLLTCTYSDGADVLVKWSVQILLCHLIKRLVCQFPANSSSRVSLSYRCCSRRRRRCLLDTRNMSLSIALGSAPESTRVHVARAQTSRPAGAQRSSLFKMRKRQNGNSSHQRCVQICLSVPCGFLLKSSWHNFRLYCAEIGHFSWVLSKLSGQQEAPQQYILMRSFRRASHSVSEL